VFAGDFWTFLIAWALQGFYVVWLPLEVALIFERGRRQNRGVSSTRRAAGLLVVGLQAGAIAGALAAGAIFEATGDLTVTMMIPAIAVTLIAGVIWLGVPESEPTTGRRLDTWGFVLLTWGLLLVTGALVYMRMIPLPPGLASSSGSSGSNCDRTTPRSTSGSCGDPRCGPCRRLRSSWESACSAPKGRCRRTREPTHLSATDWGCRRRSART
jgi:hypothetical protein